MESKIINGKALAQNIRNEIKEKVAKLSKKPGLAVIIVGTDPASQVYVKNKHKDCAEVGIISFKYELEEKTTEEEVLSLIEKLNSDDNVHGIITQLPLPKHINEKKVIDAISPLKDADCFHPVNLGEMMVDARYDSLLPATPKGVIRMLESEGLDFSGKNAVVIGRSNIVGKPVGMLLLQKSCTVTYCHSKTKNLSEITKQADILVAAIGKPNFVKADMIKEGAVLVDVGINSVNGKLVGDIDFESVKEKASLITPVPGGVGPMTRAMLLDNTMIAYNNQNR